MTKTPFIYIQKVKRNFYEAETDGLVASFTLIPDWFPEVEGEVLDGQSAYDGCYTNGDGEKFYETLVVPEGGKVEDFIRSSMLEKVATVENMVASYSLAEQIYKRYRVSRTFPFLNFFNEGNSIKVSNDGYSFTFEKDTSRPGNIAGAPYAYYTYTVNDGEATGEVEIRGDHAPVYEILPIAQAYIMMHNARKHFASQKADA